MKSIKIYDKHNCSGCSACYSVCPTKAIKMKSDKEGFLYPIVDEIKCINCGLCTKICPYINEKFPKEDLEYCYAAYNKNSEVREISSSGGVFFAMAEKILEDGGIVYGAAYDDKYTVYHTSVDKVEDLIKIVGSKYMQSRMGTCFEEIKEKLKKDIKVLFVGTSCQIAGLKSYLKVEFTNLICVDFICLGVPSPLVWRKYLEQEFDISEIKRINFKDKTSGWHDFSLKIEMDKKIYIENGRKNIFFNGYFKGLYSRPSCSTCMYKVNNRVSDITISDCWGYSKIAPEIDDNRGLSSIVIHSLKGMDFWNDIKDKFVYKETDVEDVRKYNCNYCTPFSETKERASFWDVFINKSPRKAFRKFCRVKKHSKISIITRKIVNKAKKVLKSR